jgi:hypothetical protein
VPVFGRALQRCLDVAADEEGWAVALGAGTGLGLEVAVPLPDGADPREGFVDMSMRLMS